MKKSRKKTRKRGTPPPGGRPRGKSYPLSLRRKAVRLYLEESIPARLIVQELGVGRETLLKWVKRYREEGEAGLRNRVRGESGPAPGKIPPAVKHKIVALKQKHPLFGVRRISQLLKRGFMMPASPETVRRTLQEKELIVPKKPKPRRNPPKPRFFERSTPNQLWQSDIFTFRQGGQNAYLIGYIDDYSRYVVGLGLFRSQTAENVLEVYREAIGEYGLPREMLTDNGRQYTNWRGKTRFEKEMQRDRVHHFRSRPHHPMTLGKIERFWKTIWEEFLSRASFNGLEEARDRVRLWVKYYNHKRPHQGIGGMVPADRFFRIHKGLREVIEKGIAANAEELALHGEPKSPFYLVGRMGSQSVVIQEERGQVRMTIDDEDRKQELVHNLGEGRADENDGDEGEGGREEGQGAEDPRGEGALRGGPGSVDGAEEAVAGLPADGDHGGGAVELAGPGDEGYAGGPGAEGEDGRGPRPLASSEAGGEAEAEGGGERREADEALQEAGEDQGRGEEGGGEDGIIGYGDDEEEPEEGRPDGAGASDGGDDHRGPGGEDHRPGSGPEAGGLGQDLLQVGEEGAGRTGDGPGGEGGWASPAEEGPGEGDLDRGAGPVPGGGADLEAEVPYPGAAG